MPKFDSLTELAKKIALNLVNVSLGDLVSNEVISEIYRNKSIAAKKEFKEERFIVVIGAGASYNACNKIPLGMAAAREIKNKFPNIQNLIERELDRLEKVYKLDRNVFETVLLAISKFHPKQLVEEVYKLHHHKYYPNLCYEILAHLLKHRFVDAIINFNFDELLDQAIDDELDDDEYLKVVSDGDVHDNFSGILFNGRLKQPLYIKPHGTASHKSTMRFTGEDYFGLPNDIEALIKVLLSGATSISNGEPIPVHKGDSEEKRLPVNLIVVGFNMQSFEFNTLIEKNMPPGSNIYFFNPVKPPVDQTWDHFFQKKNFFRVHDRPDNAYDSLDNWMLTLWREIYSQFETEYQPRDIERHEIVSLLFSNKKELKTSREVNEYLRDRTFIELALSIAKYKGFMGINQLTNDRFGKYFHIYNKRQEEINPEKKLYLYDMLKKFGFTDYGYSRKAFISKRLPVKRDAILTFKAEIFDGPYFEHLFHALLEKGVLSPKTRNKLEEKNNREKFRQVLKALNRKDDTEICPRYDKIYDNVFINPIVIKTPLAFGYYTNYYLENLDWDAIFIVAESGEWLLNKVDLQLLRNKTIKLIIADPVSMDRLKEKLKHCLPDSEVVLLNWWRHNQHMTIFLKRRKNKALKIIKSIYFTRRMRSPHINPVVLDEEDSRVIIETFTAYMFKAENFENNIIDRSQVLKKLDRLMGKN